jgi:CspA family cold shock protein
VTFAKEPNRSVRSPLKIDQTQRILAGVNDHWKAIVMNSGTVKWFNSTKGFGFIQPDDGAADVFVHISAVERAGMRGLADGQKISYDLVRDQKSGKNSADNLRAA